ncbi:hypothetical protein GCM10010266_64560 [Streptomyces griseomycini]|nr:hypothetical protein GCM10010266_64560 [Streptomyces griseomycini]
MPSDPLRGARADFGRPGRRPVPGAGAAVPPRGAPAGGEEGDVVLADAPDEVVQDGVEQVVQGLGRGQVQLGESPYRVVDVGVPLFDRSVGVPQQDGTRRESERRRPVVAVSGGVA